MAPVHRGWPRTLTLLTINPECGVAFVALGSTLFWRVLMIILENGVACGDKPDQNN